MGYYDELNKPEMPVWYQPKQVDDGTGNPNQITQSATNNGDVVGSGSGQTPPAEVAPPAATPPAAAAAPSATSPAAAAAPAAETPPAATPPTAAPKQTENLVDFAEKANQGYATADAMQSSIEAARQANETAQAQQLAAYDATPFRPLGFYEQLQKTLNPYKPPTAAEIQRQLKRERGQKTIAAVGDAISAIANLWGTSQGALNAYDGKNTLSQRYADMYEKLRQERKADQEKYYQTYMAALGMDDANANAQRTNAISRAGVGAANARYNYAALVDASDKMRARADQYAQFAQGQANTDRAFEEGKRQFDENKRLQQQQIGISAGHLALARQQYNDANIRRFVLSDGALDVNTKYLTPNNVDYIYEKLKGSLYADAKKDGKGRYTGTYAQFLRDEKSRSDANRSSASPRGGLSGEDKLSLVQKYLTPKAEAAIREVHSGKKASVPQKQQDSKKQQKNDNRPTVTY